MKNEIAFYNREDALEVAELLLENGYVVMISVEEQLTIINYLDGSFNSYQEKEIADRNAVVFMSREEFDFKYFEMEAEEESNETD